MKTIKKIVFIGLTLLFVNGFSQSITPPASIDVIMEVAPGDSTMQIGDSVFKSNTNLIGKMIVVLNDTIGINKIHVKLGSNTGLGDLKTKIFSFSEEANFTDGTSFKRIKNVIYIGLGVYTGLNYYFGEAKLEDFQGVLTSSVAFNNMN